jgi:hypothetical protein
VAEQGGSTRVGGPRRQSMACDSGVPPARLRRIPRSRRSSDGW